LAGGIAWLHLPLAFGAFSEEVSAAFGSVSDLGGPPDVLVILSGSERVRVHPATLRPFTERFARSNFHDTAIQPSYGLAETTVYATTRTPAQPREIVHFKSGTLSAGHAQRCESGTGTPLVSYGVPRSPMIRIIDPDTNIECRRERPVKSARRQRRYGLLAKATEKCPHGDNMPSADPRTCVDQRHLASRCKFCVIPLDGTGQMLA
jgi:acyl-CoA synthetase (AMP-forming)/AMP-acid ligase II